MNEPRPRSQHFGEMWLNPEELRYQSNGGRVVTAIARAGSNAWFGATGRKESRQNVVEVLEGL